MFKVVIHHFLFFSANCSAGSFRNLTTNECEICEAGSYQPEAFQTSCISCGNQTTSEPGSTSEEQCRSTCITFLKPRITTLCLCTLNRFCQIDLRCFGFQLSAILATKMLLANRRSVFLVTEAFTNLTSELRGACDAITDS